MEQTSDSGLIERCRRGWYTPMAELTNEQLATYLRQKIAVSLVAPEAHRRIIAKYVDATELYNGELQEAFKSATGAHT